MKSLSTFVLFTAFLTLPALADAGPRAPRSPAPAASCTSAPTGLLAWYPGEFDARDIVGGFDGSLVNGATTSPGLVGDALTFDGVGGGQDDRVDLPHAVLDGLSEFSVVFWVNSMEPVGGLVSAANPSTDNEVLLIIDGNDLDVWDQARQCQTQVTVNDGVWHLVAHVKRADGAVVTHLDGDPTCLFFFAGALEVAPTGLVLGQDQDSVGGGFDTGQAFDGQIDELLVFDRALDQDEIDAIFRAGAAGLCP